MDRILTETCIIPGIVHKIGNLVRVCLHFGKSFLRTDPEIAFFVEQDFPDMITGNTVIAGIILKTAEATANGII
jgi:hypothetical protein